MAGFYPDVPSWRMAYDVDGTQAYAVATTGIEDRTSWLSAWNGENPSTWPENDANYHPVLIFPELRDLDGALVITGTTTTGKIFDIQVSSDTTNGEDGTWTTWITGHSPWRVGDSKVEFRTKISTSTALGVKGVKFIEMVNGGQVYRVAGFHLYGEPAPNENPQRLEIWHPTLDQRLGPADLDWGDVPRNSEEIREFRVKNMHPTLTANSVRVAMSILTDTTPSVVGQQAISMDGGSTWGAQQTLTNPLGPEEISPVLHIRRQTPTNATLGLWWYRVFADCSSWT